MVKLNTVGMFSFIDSTDTFIVRTFMGGWCSIVFDNYSQFKSLTNCTSETFNLNDYNIIMDIFLNKRKYFSKYDDGEFECWNVDLSSLSKEQYVKIKSKYNKDND